MPEEPLLKIAASSQELCYACVNYMSKEIHVMYDYMADSLFGKMGIASYEIPLSHPEHDCEMKQVDVCEEVLVCCNTHPNCKMVCYYLPCMQ